jgi:hypothetical protein
LAGLGCAGAFAVATGAGDSAAVVMGAMGASMRAGAAAGLRTASCAVKRSAAERVRMYPAE